MTSRRTILKTIPLLALGKFAMASATSVPSIAFRFAIASDGHYGQPDTPFEQYHREFVRWMNQEKLQKGLDLIVINGDVIHDEPTLLYDVKNVFKHLNTPYFVTRGNHDRVAADVWESTWGYATNHSFVRNNYAFILLDTSNEKGEYICADYNYLQQQLEQHKDKESIFVFMHISQKLWASHSVDCPEICTLLENTPNVKAIFHGHDHFQDGHKIANNKPYLFDGHFGGSWGTHYRGYRIVEIYKDSTWKTYQYNPTAEPILNTYQPK